jgi:hypothetical protein
MSNELTQATFRVKDDARTIFCFFTRSRTPPNETQSSFFCPFLCRLCAFARDLSPTRAFVAPSCFCVIRVFRGSPARSSWKCLCASYAFLCIPMCCYAFLCIPMRSYALSMPFLYSVPLLFAAKTRHLAAKTRLTKKREAKNSEIADQLFPSILHPSAFPLLLLK